MEPIHQRGLGVIGAAAVSIAIAWCYGLFETPLPELLNLARLSLQAGNFQAAERATIRALKQQPHDAEALLLAATAVAEQGRFESAVDYCLRVPTSAGHKAADARCFAGNVCSEQLHQIDDAKRHFKSAIDIVPDHRIANDRMVDLLSIETRGRELIPFQVQLLRKNAVSPLQMYTLVLCDQLYPDMSRAREFHEADPKATGPLLALAQHARMSQQPELALQILESAIAADHTDLDAQSRYGHLLLDGKAFLRFRDWHGNLPANADGHPDIWSARGRYALAIEQHQTAARCFWESVRLDPNTTLSNYGLGQALVAMDRDSDAQPFLVRAARIQQYIRLIDVGGPHSRLPTVTIEFLENAAELAEELGLTWEAVGWTKLARQSGRDSSKAKLVAERLQPLMDSLPLQRLHPDSNPGAAIDLSHFPRPDWDKHAESQSGTARDMSPLPTITFTDRADDVGLEFTYVNGAKRGIRGLQRVFEYTGGGVGVIDFDLDAWPDVFLTQGGEFPRPKNDTRHQDRLFRNRQSQTMQDVTRKTGIAGIDYSQGVSVGDFDNDGFPDVFVGNLGHNRLFKNNGDGTFTDQSAEIEGDTAQWTTSCLIADLNADGYPDLYSVNYLAGDDVTERICRDESGILAECGPQNFPAAQDQLHLNTGNGRFVDATLASGITCADGKGMGIVAADFTLDHRIDVFVANDGVANFLFESTTGPDDATLFVENALARGVALNLDGRPEACMGIAAADLNGDQTLDLFVTNFSSETNTLFENTSHGIFRDVSWKSGLDTASFAMLGFGTQAIDVDLDGRLDLFVANGHIDDYSQSGTLYEMPAQLFYNRGNLAFEEVLNDGIGDYFQSRRLGRGAARLDWNRDGAEDLIVSHLETPCALLENTTPDRGRFLVVRLIGTQADRDAIGCRVTLTTDVGVFFQALVGGSGYHASNERRLVFGLGDSIAIDEVRVEWLSGMVQSFDNIPLDGSITIIQGRPSPYELDR